MGTSSVRRALLTLAICLTIVIATAPSAWAFKGLATITGAVQGQIQGDNTTKDGAGAIVVRAMGFGLERPIDFATGAISGKARFQPFKLVKEPDRATPKLLRAAVTAETLTVEIKWYRTISTGVVQHYFTVRLENAVIASMESEGDVTVAGGVLETLGLAYGKIVMKDEINGTMAEAVPAAP